MFCSDAAVPGRHWRTKSARSMSWRWMVPIDRCGRLRKGDNHRGYSPVMVYVARRPLRPARELLCETVSFSVQAGHPSSPHGTAHSEPAGQKRQRWAGGEGDQHGQLAPPKVPAMRAA